MIRKSISLLIIFTLVFGTFVYAEDNTMTVEEAIEKATEDESAIDDLNDTIKDLWKSYYAATAGKKQIQDSLDALDKFEKLYDKEQNGESLTVDETNELALYKMIYGKKPPHYTSQEMLDKFIKPRDFGYAATYAEIQKLKNTRSTILPNVEKATRDLYDQVVGLQNTLALQEAYVMISTEQHNQKIQQHALGQISDVDLENSAQNLEILKMQIEQLKNNLDSLEMNFNKLIDVPVTIKYQFKDTVGEIYNIDPIHKTLDEYLSDALVNRTEVKNARIDYDVKEREDSIIKNYLFNELLTDRVNADIALIKAKYALEEAEATVQDNIADGYISMMTYWNDYQNSLSSLELAKKNLEDIKARFDLGQVTQVTVDLTEYQVKTSENTVKSNLRNYYNSVIKMENASGIGPAY